MIAWAIAGVSVSFLGWFHFASSRMPSAPDRASAEAGGEPFGRDPAAPELVRPIPPSPGASQESGSSIRDVVPAAPVDSSVGTLVGRIVDDTSQPVVGARVQWKSWDRTGEFVTTSSPDGAFELNEVPRDVALDLYASMILDPTASPRRIEFDFELVLKSERSDLGPLVVPRCARVRGVVVDESGVPIVGARVVRHDSDDAYVVTTDPTGRFEYSTEDFWFRVLLVPRASGFVAEPREDDLVALSVGTQIDDLELRMVRSTSLRGRVSTVGGEPIADATVRCVSSSMGDSPWFSDREIEVAATCTDARGGFSIDRPRSEDAVLVVEHRSFERWTIPVANWTGKDVRLEALPRLRIRLVDTSLRLIAASRVTVFMSRDRSGSTVRLDRVRDFDGESWNLEAHPPDEPFDLDISVPGYSRKQLTGMTEASFDRRVLDVILERGVSLHGFVLRSDDSPIEGVSVKALRSGDESPNRYVGWASTDLDGRFVVDDLPRVPLVIEAQSPGGPPHPRVEFDPTATDSSPIVFRLSPLSGIEGRVLSERFRDSLRPGFCIVEEKSHHWLGVPDASGHFRFEGIAPGDHALFLSFQGFAWSNIDRHRLRRVRVDEGALTHLEIDLDSEGFGCLSGQASIDGHPAAGARIELQLDVSGAGQVSIPLKADGGFVSPPLVPGVYLLELVPLGAEDAIFAERARVTVNETRRIDIDVRTGSVRGDVVDAVTKERIRDAATRDSIELSLMHRIRDVEEDAVFSWSSGVPIRIDRDGSFSIRGLARGQYEIAVDGCEERYSDEHVVFEVREGVETSLDLELAAPGRVEIRFDRPPSIEFCRALRVELERADGARWRRDLAHDDGKWVLSDRGVPEGNYRARFLLREVPGESRELAHRDFEVRSSETTTITLPGG